MKKKNRKVVNATRDAVVNAVKRMETLRKKTGELAKKAQKRWKESKPQREKAERELKKGARRAVAFGKEVRDGLKQGLSEIQKRNKKRT